MERFLALLRIPLEGDRCIDKTIMEVNLKR